MEGGRLKREREYNRHVENKNNLCRELLNWRGYRNLNLDQ